MSSLTLDAFRHALSPERVRQMQVVHLAVAGGPLAFACVVLFLTQRLPDAPEAGASSLQLLQTLSLVHAGLFAGSFPLALLLPRSIAARGIADAASREAEPNMAALHALGALRNALVIRLALLEGVALFGLVICLLAGLDGLLAEHPLVWLNASTTLVLLVVAALSLPTRERIEGLFREYAGA